MRAVEARRACRTAREHEELPGLAVAAASTDGVVFAEAWGEADLENHVPLAAEGVFEIASVTKLFTAEAVMLLVQDGALALGSTLGEVLPELPEAWHPVQMASILAHQSGLPSYTEADGYWQGVALDRGARGILGLVSGLPLRFEPGERFAYDNTGFYLLGMVIERVSGRSYDAFLQERLLRPLGLPSVRVNDPKELVPARVRGYSRDDVRIVNSASYSSDNTYSAGALLASVADLARFGAAETPRRSLAPELRRLMRTPRPTRLGNERMEGFQVGLGWFLTDVGERHFEGHGGSIVGFRSCLIRLPDRGVSVAVLSNGDWWRDPEGLALEVAGCVR